MLKDLHLLDDGEVVIVGGHAQHQAVLHIERDLADVPELSDEGVQRVSVWHPANQPCMSGMVAHAPAIITYVTGRCHTGLQADALSDACQEQNELLQSMNCIG